jgi:AcrR family transcriptional regulator
MDRAKKTSKDADDWVQAGLLLLAKQGIDAVKVERLAAALGVTKGSFYWHFRDRDALLSALLVRWQAISTQAIIERVSSVGGTPKERLTALVDATSQSKRAPQVEQAVRAWAARERQARVVLEAVDSQREAYVRDLLVEHGLSPLLAQQRARVLYLALIGEFVWVSHGGQPSGTGPWHELVRLLLS